MVKKKQRPVTATTPKSEGGPDYASSHKLHKLGLYPPRPWVMRYPNTAGVRREVGVDVQTWRGFSIGAGHYYAKVRVEENAIWDPEKLLWYINNDLTECKVIRFEADVLTRAEAVEFVRVVLHTFYADKAIYKWQVRGGLYTEAEDWDTIQSELSEGD